MGGVKRKETAPSAAVGIKKQKTSKDGPGQANGKTSKVQSRVEEEDFGGFPDQERSATDTRQRKEWQPKKPYQHSSSAPKQFKLEMSSAEAHAKQRALAKERKANKPNSDGIQRSKKIWERLRRKSHVATAERKELVAELFTIITGQVNDYVFKHDSVRVIQCALKYANQEQRRQISRELAQSIRPLVESRYGKFLVAKLVQDRDEQIRDAVIPEFYGHVRRLANHPEASWIVDDIYRQVATPQQKAMMLREWYGAEFALFQRKGNAKTIAIAAEDDTADLVQILDKNPEKRKPILQYLLQMINGLIQKKMTGFTMLHDAMLQYFTALTDGSPERAEFLEILKGDIDAETEGGGGDLYRNLSFTKSGSKLVCFALAYSGAKDRKVILKCFRDTIELMAYDQYAKTVLVTALDVLDDTKLTSRAILSEILGLGIDDETQRLDRLEQIVMSVHARLPLLYPLAGTAKWLLADAGDKAFIDEIHQIRKETSKKAPEVRRQELVDYMSGPLLELIAKGADRLVQSSFGCQFIAETLLESQGADKSAALSAVAQTAAGDPKAEGHIARDPAASRMLKTLVLGGPFDPTVKKVRLCEPRLGFAALLYAVIGEGILDWACSDSSFVVVAYLEGEDVPESIRAEIKGALKKERKRLEACAVGDGGKENTKAAGPKEAGGKSEGNVKGNAGARMILEKLG